MVSPTSVAAPCRFEETEMQMMAGTGEISRRLQMARATGRRDHQHCGDIVHEGGDQAGEQREGQDHPLDGAHAGDDEIAELHRHAGIDEEIDGPHGAGDHHQYVPVDLRECVDHGITELRKDPEASDDHEQDRGSDGDHGPELLDREHQYIGNDKDDQRKYGCGAHGSSS